MYQNNSMLCNNEKQKTTGLVKRIYCQVKLWSRNQKTRRQLQQLPPRLLQDIGVSQAQADTEADKSFWQ